VWQRGQGCRAASVVEGRVSDIDVAGVVYPVGFDAVVVVSQADAVEEAVVANAVVAAEAGVAVL
jgi:hypothetical protein